MPEFRLRLAFTLLVLAAAERIFRGVLAPKSSPSHLWYATEVSAHTTGDRSPRQDCILFAIRVQSLRSGVVPSVPEAIQLEARGYYDWRTIARPTQLPN